MSTWLAVTEEEPGRTHPPGPPSRDSLPRNALFRSLTAAELVELVGGGWSSTVPRGDILFCEGEPLQQRYFIQRGSVKLTRSSEEGKELIIGLAGAGDSFGPLIRSYPAPYLAQALEETVLFAVPLTAIRRIAAASPVFAMDLLGKVESDSMAAQSQAAQLAFDSVPRRLSQLLLSLSGPSGALRFPLNQTEMANLIGSSRETVCSVLNRLRRKEILAIVKGRIRVLDRHRLAEVR